MRIGLGSSIFSSLFSWSAYFLGLPIFLVFRRGEVYVRPVAARLKPTKFSSNKILENPSFTGLRFEQLTRSFKMITVFKNS
jgi:hypothetical protein